jgi:PqqD family protein of HPr-rel-A system
VKEVFERVPDLRVEPIGEGWAAFSGLSGETLLMNDEAAALLEVLCDGPAAFGELCAAIAKDASLPPGDIQSRVMESWDQFVRAGLVRQV